MNLVKLKKENFNIYLNFYKNAIINKEIIFNSIEKSIDEHCIEISQYPNHEIFLIERNKEYIGFIEMENSNLVFSQLINSYQQYMQENKLPQEIIKKLNIKINNLEKINKKLNYFVEISYINIVPKYRNQKIATEIILQILSSKNEKYFVRIDMKNKAGINLFTKLNFKGTNDIDFQDYSKLFSLLILKKIN